MLTTPLDSSIRQVGWPMVAARAQRPAALSAALQHAADHQRAACCGRGQRHSTRCGIGSSTFLHRRASAMGSGSRPNFEQTACELYARDQHGWKLWCCLLCALGTDRSSARNDSAIRWSAVAAKMAGFAASALRSLIELRPTRVCRMSETRLRMLKSVL